MHSIEGTLLTPVLCVDCHHYVPFGWIDSTEVKCPGSEHRYSHRIPTQVWDHLKHLHDEPPEDDNHCPTCQCAGTECRKNEWCKRVWGHAGACNTVREEGF